MEMSLSFLAFTGLRFSDVFVSVSVSMIFHGVLKLD